jgi:hypothetical protein
MPADDWLAGDPELPLVDLPAVAVPSRSSCSRVLWNSVSVVSLPLVNWEVFALANDCPASPFPMAAGLAVGEVLPETLYDGGRPLETECTAMLSILPSGNTLRASAANYCRSRGKVLPLSEYSADSLYRAPKPVANRVPMLCHCWVGYAVT